MAKKTIKMGTVPINRGEYNPSTIYYKDNLVQFEGWSYICIVNKVSGALPTDETKFKIFASSKFKTLPDNSIGISNFTQAAKAFIGSEGTITNAPDDEDLTVTEDNLLKFKDKEYNATNASGLGKVILRKNLKEGINILTKEMLPSTNTCYIIQYDYNLNGKKIVIPENCTLKFDGGSFSNGIIDFNGAVIDSVNTCLKRINIVGNLQSKLDVTWFGAKGDGVFDNTEVLNSINEYFFRENKTYTRSIYFPPGTYNLHEVELPKNTLIEGSGTGATVLRYNGVGGEHSHVIKIQNCSTGGLKNLTIRAEGLAWYCAYLHNDNGPSGSGLVDMSSTWHDLKFTDALVDSIHCDLWALNFHLRNVGFWHYGRHAIYLAGYVTDGNNFSIGDFTSDNNYKSFQESVRDQQGVTTNEAIFNTFLGIYNGWRHFIALYNARMENNMPSVAKGWVYMQNCNHLCEVRKYNVVTNTSYIFPAFVHRKGGESLYPTLGISVYEELTDTTTSLTAASTQDIQNALKGTIPIVTTKVLPKGHSRIYLKKAADITSRTITLKMTIPKESCRLILNLQMLAYEDQNSIMNTLVLSYSHYNNNNGQHKTMYNFLYPEGGSVRWSNDTNNYYLHIDFKTVYKDAIIVGDVYTAKEMPYDVIADPNISLPSFPLPKKGTSDDRPRTPQIGFDYYDTTLSKWVKWNGTSWDIISGEVAPTIEGQDEIQTIILDN